MCVHARVQGATMALDLCDRDGKYSNGFCHWPQPAWRKADGTWVASRVSASLAPLTHTCMCTRPAPDSGS